MRNCQGSPKSIMRRGYGIGWVIFGHSRGSKWDSSGIQVFSSGDSSGDSSFFKFFQVGFKFFQVGIQVVPSRIQDSSLLDSFEFI